MSFEKAITRSLRGEKTVLKSISTDGEEYYIVPKKFDVAAMDEYGEYQNKQRKRLGPTARQLMARKSRELREKREAAGGVEEITEEDIIASLGPEDLLSIYSDADDTVNAVKDLYGIFIRHGIAEHNFSDNCGQVTEKMVTLLFKNPDLCQEIYGIVFRFNRFSVGKKKPAR